MPAAMAPVPSSRIAAMVAMAPAFDEVVAAAVPAEVSEEVGVGVAEEEALLVVAAALV